MVKRVFDASNILRFCCGGCQTNYALDTEIVWQCFHCIKFRVLTGPPAKKIYIITLQKSNH